jgi:hypothetical protein
LIVGGVCIVKDVRVDIILGEGQVACVIVGVFENEIGRRVERLSGTSSMSWSTFLLWRMSLLINLTIQYCNLKLPLKNDIAVLRCPIRMRTNYKWISSRRLDVLILVGHIRVPTPTLN